MARAAEFLPGLDQPLMDRIVLVGALRDDGALDRLSKPGPLEYGGFEDRGRRVRVVLQQLYRIFSVEAEIEPAIEAELIVVPAVRYQRPIGRRDFQALQILLVLDRLADKFEAHRVDFAGRRLDLALDLVQRERVVGALVPIAFAVDRVEVEPCTLGSGAPVVALGADDASHRGPKA